MSLILAYFIGLILGAAAGVIFWFLFRGLFGDD